MLTILTYAESDQSRDAQNQGQHKLQLDIIILFVGVDEFSSITSAGPITHRASSFSGYRVLL